MSVLILMKRRAALSTCCAHMQGMGLVLDAEGALGSKRSKRCTMHAWTIIEVGAPRAVPDSILLQVLCCGE